MVHGRHRNKALAAARRVRAVELKTAGYTYAQVADELGYTSRGTAYNIVAKALREQTAEAVTDLRDLENARLDALQLALWVAAMTGDQCRCCRREDRAGTGHLNGLQPVRIDCARAPADTANTGGASNSVTHPCRMAWVASMVSLASRRTMRSPL